MENDRFRLDNKVALVTGGGQGIGSAIAVALAESGASVAVTDLRSNAKGIAQVCEKIASHGGVGNPYELDVTDINSIPGIFDQVLEDMGSLDILVNNAGVRIRNASLAVTEDEWDHILNVNLKGMFFCAQAAARHMIRANNGRIINVTSQLSITALPERAAYCASKGGAVNLTRSLALEWIEHGITVNAIGPGPTETPMVESMSPGVKLELESRSPIGRRLDPEDITGSVVFLASDAASAVTGHLLMVDAGWTAW